VFDEDEDDDDDDEDEENDEIIDALYGEDDALENHDDDDDDDYDEEMNNGDGENNLHDDFINEMLDLDETFDEFIDESLLFKKQHQQNKQRTNEIEANSTLPSSSNMNNEGTTTSMPKLKANFQSEQSQTHSEHANASVLIDEEHSNSSQNNKSEASSSQASISNNKPIIASGSSHPSDVMSNLHKSHSSGLLRKRTSNTLTGLSSKLFSSHHSSIKVANKATSSPRSSNPTSKSINN